MVDLVTVKTVLAVDLGMSTPAIESYLGERFPGAAGPHELTLAEALQVVADAETLVPSR